MVTNFFHPPTTTEKTDKEDLKSKEIPKPANRSVASDEDSLSGDDKDLRRMHHEVSDSDDSDYYNEETNLSEENDSVLEMEDSDDEPVAYKNNDGNAIARRP
jgi:hypothetical protein